MSESAETGATLPGRISGGLSYNQVREQNLRVMDPTAITQCMEHDMPILVFNFQKQGNIERAVCGERVGTLISSQQGELSERVKG